MALIVNDDTSLILQLSLFSLIEVNHLLLRPQIPVTGQRTNWIRRFSAHFVCIDYT